MKSDQLAEDLGVTTNTATSTTRRYFMPLSGWDAADWIPERPAWQADAACAGMDPELFHPARGESTQEAKAVCRGCDVRDDCLEYALANNEKFGLWGGRSERERRRLRRARRRSVA